MDRDPNRPQIKNTEAIFEGKYRKALKQINNLLGSNRQLKFELENLKSKYEMNAYNNSNVEQLEKERESLMFDMHRLEDGLREAESAKEVLENQLNNYKSRVQTIKNQFEQQLLEQREEAAQRENEYRAKIQMMSQAGGGSEGALLQDYRVALDKYKNQQLSWQSEKKSLYDHILDLENELEQGKRQYERLNDRANVQIHEIAQKIRKEAQEQILNYRTEIGNLKEALQQRIAENEGLTKEARQSLDYTLDRQKEEAQLVQELKAEINSLRSQMKRITENTVAEETTSKSVEKLKLDLLESGHRTEAMRVENEELKRVVQQLKTTIESQKTMVMRSLSTTSAKPPTTTSNQDHSLISQIATLKSDLREKEQIIGRLRQDNQRLRAQVQGQLERADSEGFRPPSPTAHSNEEKTVLQARIKDFKGKVEQLVQEHDGGNPLHYQLRVLLAEIEERVKLLSGQSISRTVKNHPDYRHHHHHHSSCAKYEAQLRSKIQSYDRLASRLEEELERAIRLGGGSNSVTSHRYDSTVVHEITNVRIADMQERLNIQEKHFKQELETQQLDFDSRLLTYRNQIETMREQLVGFQTINARSRQMSETILRLERTNGQLNFKISDLESRLLQARRNAGQGSQNTVTAELLQLINKLSQKDSYIIELEYSNQSLSDAAHKHNQRVDRLNSDLQERQVEIDRLKGLLVHSTREHQKILLENKQLGVEVQSKIEEIRTLKNLEATIQTLKRQIEEKVKAYERLNAEYHKQRIRTTALEADIQALQDTLERSKREVDNYKRIVSELDTKLNELYSINSRLKDQLNRIEDDETRRINDASAVTNQYERKLKESIQEFERRHTETVNSYEKRISEITINIDQQLWRLNDEHERATADTRRTHDRKVKELRDDYENQLHDLEMRSSRTIAELNSQLGIFRSEVERVREFESLYQTERNNHFSVKTQLKLSEERVSQLEIELSRLRHSDSLISELTRKVQDWEYKYESDLSGLKFERQRFEKLKAQRDQEFEDLNAQYNRERFELTEHIRRLKAQIAELQASRVDFRFGSGNTRESEFTFKISSLTDQNHRYKMEIEMLNQELITLREVQQKNIQLERRISEIGFGREDEQFRLEQMNKEIARLRESLTEFQAKYQEVEVTLREYQRINKAAQYEIYDLKLQNQKLSEHRTGSSELYDEIDRLRTLVATLEQDINVLRLKYTGSMNNEQRLKENLALFVIVFAEVEALRLQLSTKDQEIDELIRARNMRASLSHREISEQNISVSETHHVQQTATNANFRVEQNLSAIRKIKEQIAQMSEYSKNMSVQVISQTSNQQISHHSATLQQTVVQQEAQARQSIHTHLQTIKRIDQQQLEQQKQQQQQIISTVTQDKPGVARVKTEQLPGSSSHSPVDVTSERQSSGIQELASLRVNSVHSSVTQPVAPQTVIVAGPALYNFQPIRNSQAVNQQEPPQNNRLIRFSYSSSGVQETSLTAPVPILPQAPLVHSGFISASESGAAVKPHHIAYAPIQVRQDAGLVGAGVVFNYSNPRN